MQIIDAHHHLWDLARLPYPWLRPEAGPRPFGDHTSIKRDYHPADYAADCGAAIVGSVHVQANAGAGDPVIETAWVAEQTQDCGWPVAIVGEVQLADLALADTIARHAAYRAFRGVRLFAGYDADPRWRQCADPALLQSAAAHDLAATLARGGYSLDVVVHAAQLHPLADLARAVPDLAIIVNHLGQPRTSDFAGAGLWRDGISRAAAEPNICVKLSGLWTIDRTWRPEVLAPFVRHVVSAFGAGRCMYGSNLPIERVMLPARHQVPRLLEALGDMPEADRDAIFGRTARRFYRLSIG